MKGLNFFLSRFINENENLLREAPTGTMSGYQDPCTWASEIIVVARDDGLMAILSLSINAEADDTLFMRLDMVTRHDDGLKSRRQIPLRSNEEMRSHMILALQENGLTTYRLEKPWVKEFQAHVRHLINRLPIARCQAS